MNTACCSGGGKFMMGMAAGMMAGTVLGMAMAPSHRQIKRAAHQAAKRVNEAVDHFTEALEL